MSKSSFNLSSYGSFGSGSGIYEYEYEYEFEISIKTNSFPTSLFTSITENMSSQTKTVRVMGYGINLI